jgi:hypothetical protein
MAFCRRDISSSEILVQVSLIENIGFSFSYFPVLIVPEKLETISTDVLFGFIFFSIVCGAIIFYIPLV